MHLLYHRVLPSTSRVPAKNQFGLQSNNSVACRSARTTRRHAHAVRLLACPVFPWYSAPPSSALLSEHRTPSALGPKRHLRFSEAETHPTGHGPTAHVRTCADDPSLVTQVSPQLSSSFHWSVVPHSQNPRVREKLEALVVLPLLGRAASRCAKRDDDSKEGASRCLVGQAHKPPAGPHHQ